MSAQTSHHDSSGGGDATMEISAVVIVLAVVTLICRFYTRIFTRAGLWWDDWLILAAVFFALWTAALLIWGDSVDPTGSEKADHKIPDYVFNARDVYYLKLTFASSVVYFSIAGATKLGIVVMYYRIFSINRIFRYQLVAAGILVIAFWIGCTVATLTNCVPLKWTWTKGPEGLEYCFNYNIFWMAAGVCEILLDVMILALPVRAVAQLSLSLNRKVTIIGLFLLGGFVVVTGMVKTILGYVPGSTVPSYSKTEVWAVVHTGMLIVCANLPVLRPLVSRVAKLLPISRISSLYNSWRTSQASRTQSSAPEKVETSLASSTDGKKHPNTNTVELVVISGASGDPIRRSSSLERCLIHNHSSSNLVIAEGVTEHLPNRVSHDI